MTRIQALLFMHAQVKPHAVSFAARVCCPASSLIAITAWQAFPCFSFAMRSSECALLSARRYLYKDTIDMDMEPAAAAAVLQVGLYYGAARLIGLCEVVLSRTLTDANVSLEGPPRGWQGSQPCAHA